MATFTVFAAITLGYTYFGYPLILALWGRLRRAPPVARSVAFRPSVSVLIPVYNGEPYLAAKVRSIQELDYPRDRIEILISSDGSDDMTESIAAGLAAADSRIRVFHSPVRRGKPTALNEMTSAARGEVLFLTDVRQPVVPGALRALVQPLADPTIGCVSGNLVLKGATGAGTYWRYENWIRRQEGKLRSMLGVTGPIYAIRASEMVPLPPDVILDDMWVPMRLRLQGRRIAFAEGAVAYDEAFGDEREFGRKARTLAGNVQLLFLLPSLLNPFRNPSFFEFVSHKLLRLACPFLLVGLVVSSSGTIVAEWSSGELSAWIVVLLFGQLLFYLLALFPRVGGGSGRAARAFVVLNAAAVVGMLRFARRRQRVTW